MSGQPVGQRQPVGQCQPVGQRQPGLLDRALDLLFPARCLGCGLRGAALCPDCARRTPWLGGEVCPRCALPSRLGRICGRCQSENSPLDGLRAACRFEGVVRQAVHDLKYRGVTRRAALLADWIGTALEQRPVAVDLLVPVPLWPGRQRVRGFNQSERVARELAGRLGVTVEAACLRRVRDTSAQVRKSAAERQANVADAFACTGPAVIFGRRVGLVDDVATTGATLRACAGALKAGGAARVYGIVAAREV